MAENKLNKTRTISEFFETDYKDFSQYVAENRDYTETDADIDVDFSIAAIYCLVDYCDYRSNDYESWLNDGFRIASMRSSPLSEMAFLHISEASDGFRSKEDVHRKWIECCRTTTRKTSSISYYYAKLKEKYGKYWIDVVKEYQKQMKY